MVVSSRIDGLVPINSGTGWLRGWVVALSGSSDRADFSTEGVGKEWMSLKI